MSIDDLAAACRDVGQGLILVVTGAGVSLASGIPTFRGADPDAVWANDVTELGTYGYFQRDPVGSWRWYQKRFDKVVLAEPNPAHHALAALERWQRARGDFLLVTQNIDLLHERAGSRELVKVHGSADRVRCTRRDCAHGPPRGSLARADAPLAAFTAAPGEDTLPRCPACGALLRQHVLWFDEYYSEHADYQIERALRAAKQAALVVFVGTSFAVGITDMVLERALGRGRPVFSIDPTPRAPHPRVRAVTAAAESALPALVAALSA